MTGDRIDRKIDIHIKMHIKPEKMLHIQFATFHVRNCVIPGVYVIDRLAHYTDLGESRLNGKSGSL